MSGRRTRLVRIAIATESFFPRTNGVTNSVANISRRLVAQGHQVTIICPNSFPESEYAGIPVITVPSTVIPGIADFDVAVSSVPRLTHIIRSIRPDIIHVASPFVLGALALRAARKLSIPSVAVFQTDVSGFARHYGLAVMATAADAHVRRMHVQADVNLVPSSATENYLRTLGVRHVHTWTRGVDLEIFDPVFRDEALHDSWGGPLVVGYLGRLAPEKGLMALTVLQGAPGVSLVLIGDGPERDRLAAKIPGAHFVGKRSGAELGRYVASLDVLVAPGEHETFCQVIQEAMASGLPVLAPAVGGPRDLIEPGRDGFLYRPGEPEDMMEHVALLGDDVRLRLSMGMHGRAKVRTRTWDHLTDELLHWYASAMGVGSARSA